MPINETTPNQGGYTVPVEYVKKLYKLVKEYSVAEKVMDVRMTNTASGKIAELISEVIVEYPDEGNAPNETVLTFGQKDYSCKRFACRVIVTEDWKEDTFASVNDLVDKMVEALAKDIDRVVFLGDGTANYNSITGLANVDLSSYADNEIDAGAGSLTYDMLLEARKVLRKQGAKNLALVISPSGEKDLLTMTDSAGQLVFSRNVSGADTIATGKLGSLLGMDVYVSLVLSDYETANGSGIAFMVDKARTGLIVKRYTDAKLEEEKVNLQPKIAYTLRTRLDYITIFPQLLVRIKNLGI